MVDQESVTDSNSLIVELLTHPTMSFLEILDENPDRTFLILLGSVTLKNGIKNNFVLKLKKKEFDTSTGLEKFQREINSILSSPTQIFNNDIYYKYLASDLIENQLKIDLVYPANAKVIDKYRRSSFMLFRETYQIYLSKTLKYINSFDEGSIQWIKNILYHDAEKPLVRHENFLILQDYNSVDNSSLINCLGIPYHCESVKSIRDVTDEHLPLLESMYTSGRKALGELFNTDETRIRAFIHYPPSFYYLHVHYLHVDYESSSTIVNRAIDLNSIIQNIQFKGNYYQTVDIECTVKIGSKLNDYLLESDT